jgi:hypothetical protein
MSRTVAPHDEPAGSAATRSSDRRPNGRFLPGNRAALGHGGRSSEVVRAALPEQPTVQSTLAEKRKAILADLGGEAQCSQLQLDLIDRYLELDTVAAWLGGHLVAEGPLTAKGRTRAALAAYVSAVDRVHRVATSLGLARREKRVSLDEYLTETYVTSESAAP